MCVRQSIDFFSCPDQNYLQSSLNYHPQHNMDNPVLQRVFFSKDGTSRKWLIYSQECQKIYCFICIAFGKTTENSPFITGMPDWRHICQRTEEHEKSKAHRNCAEAYPLKSSSADIGSLLGGSQMSTHREQV